MTEGNYIDPSWDGFDGYRFQELVCDLLAADGFRIEPSGIGPDGGVDAFASQEIRFGYNAGERFVWAVQCKFSNTPSKAIRSCDLGNIVQIVHDERFREKRVKGYFLVTNVRLAQNLVCQLRGLNQSHHMPAFRTTYLDGSALVSLINRQFAVALKFFHGQIYGVDGMKQRDTDGRTST